jgi:hypothetical protein
MRQNHVIDAAAMMGQLVSLGVLAMLLDNGMITSQQAENVADDALQTLEEFQALYPDHRRGFEMARTHLDKLVDGLRKSS